MLRILECRLPCKGRKFTENKWCFFVVSSGCTAAWTLAKRAVVRSGHLAGTSILYIVPRTGLAQTCKRTDMLRASGLGV